MKFHELLAVGVVAILPVAGIVASPLPAGDDAPILRYRSQTGSLALEVTHAIELHVDQVIEAGRTLAFDLTFAPAAAGSGVVVTIDKARATSRAHGMEQRLGTSQLRGKTFPLRIVDGERGLAPPEGERLPGIDLGPMVTGPIAVEDLVAGILPELPEVAVAPGAAWSTERSVRCLEGWDWATGSLVERHRIVGIERRDGRRIVSVESEGTGKIASAEGARAYAGDLNRTTRWSFDADAGRLVSLMLDQSTAGSSSLGDEPRKIDQTTRVVLAPAGTAGAAGGPGGP